MASGCGHQNDIAFATNGTMLDFVIVGCAEALAILQPWQNSLGYRQQVLGRLAGLHQTTAFDRPLVSPWLTLLRPSLPEWMIRSRWCFALPWLSYPPTDLWVPWWSNLAWCHACGNCWLYAIANGVSSPCQPHFSREPISFPHSVGCLGGKSAWTKWLVAMSPNGILRGNIWHRLISNPIWSNNGQPIIKRWAAHLLCCWTFGLSGASPVSRLMAAVCDSCWQVQLFFWLSFWTKMPKFLRLWPSPIGWLWWRSCLPLSPCPLLRLVRSWQQKRIAQIAKSGSRIAFDGKAKLMCCAIHDPKAMLHIQAPVWHWLWHAFGLQQLDACLACADDSVHQHFHELAHVGRHRGWSNCWWIANACGIPWSCHKWPMSFLMPLEQAHFLELPHLHTAAHGALGAVPVC